jgi:hypothetical protein
MIESKRVPRFRALALRLRGNSVIGTSPARKNAARAIQTCISPA